MRLKRHCWNVYLFLYGFSNSLKGHLAKGRRKPSRFRFFQQKSKDFLRVLKFFTETHRIAWWTHVCHGKSHCYARFSQKLRKSTAGAVSGFVVTVFRGRRLEVGHDENPDSGRKGRVGGLLNGYGRADVVEGGVFASAYIA